MFYDYTVLRELSLELKKDKSFEVMCHTDEYLVGRNLANPKQFIVFNFEQSTIIEKELKSELTIHNKDKLLDYLIAFCEGGLEYDTIIDEDTYDDKIVMYFLE